MVGHSFVFTPESEPRVGNNYCDTHASVVTPERKRLVLADASSLQRVGAIGRKERNEVVGWRGLLFSVRNREGRLQQTKGHSRFGREGMAIYCRTRVKPARFESSASCRQRWGFPIYCSPPLTYSTLTAPIIRKILAEENRGLCFLRAVSTLVCLGAVPHIAPVTVFSIKVICNHVPDFRTCRVVPNAQRRQEPPRQLPPRRRRCRCLPRARFSGAAGCGGCRTTGQSPLGSSARGGRRPVGSWSTHTVKVW